MKKTNRKSSKKIGQGISDLLPHLTNSEISKSFCKDYAAGITPKIEAADIHQARSMQKAFGKVIRKS